METAVPYSVDLHIDASTKKLVLNLINSIRSVVPVAEPPGPSDPDIDTGIEGLDHVRQVLMLARIHSHELEGLFDPEVLLRYARYVSDYQDIIMKIEQIRDELENCRDSALKFASQLAGIVEEHLQMTAPDVEENENSTPCKGMSGNNGGIKLEIV